MSTLDRFWVALLSGALAYMIAVDLGLPSWRNSPPGDATDFGFVVGFLVWHFLKGKVPA